MHEKHSDDADKKLESNDANADVTAKDTEVAAEKPAGDQNLWVFRTHLFDTGISSRMLVYHSYPITQTESLRLTLTPLCG